MWHVLTHTCLPNDVLHLVLDFWGHFHSLSFMEHKGDPYAWFLTLRDELPSNSDYVISVLHNFHSRAQQLLAAKERTVEMHPIQALLASSFLLNSPQLAKLVVTLSIPDYKFPEAKEEERWQSRLCIGLPDHLVNLRFFWQVIENKDLMTFPDLQQRVGFPPLLWQNLIIVPKGGIEFLKMAQPFIKPAFRWRGVDTGNPLS